MIDVFLNVVFPVFLVVGVAAVFQRWRQLPIITLNQITFYLLSPALSFNILVNSSLSTTVSFKVVAATLLTVLFIATTSVAVSLCLRHSRPMRSAFLLSTIFPNDGNMGLPVTLLALGNEGLSIAVVVFIVNSMYGWSFGTFIASRSEHRGLTPFIQVLKVPAIYGILAAIVTRAAGWDLPIVLSQPIDLLSSAAIPAMLLVLGFQLGSGVTWSEIPSLISAILLRLIVAAPLAYMATLLLGLEGVAQQAVILLAVMPTAIFTIILATQYNSNPRFITASVVTSTLASLGTLTVIITLIKNYLG